MNPLSPPSRATSGQLRLNLPDAEATSLLAEALAPRLGAGDLLLLEGQIGAGKTHFARALIQQKLRSETGRAEDVPSPTFTLVQTYEAGALEIWHADLYRLTDPGEVLELGLEEAFSSALCLVEWPDRLADLTPPDALHLGFSIPPEDGRILAISGPTDRLDRLKDAVPATLLASEDKQ